MQEESTRQQTNAIFKYIKKKPANSGIDDIEGTQRERNEETHVDSENDVADLDVDHEDVVHDDEFDNKKQDETVDEKNRRTKV